MTNQNSICERQFDYMKLFYKQLLYTLTEKNKFKEDDYEKLIAAIWEVDSNVLDYREFNKKWSNICDVLEIPTQYDETKTNLSGKLVPIIAAKLFDNRHIFQKYGEQSERMRKKLEDMANDTKYQY